MSHTIKDRWTIDEVLAEVNALAHRLLDSNPAVTTSGSNQDALTLRFLEAAWDLPPHEIGENWHLCFETWEIIQQALCGNPWAYEHAIKCSVCVPHLLPHLCD